MTRLSKGEATHRWPQLLPGGQAVLFTASPTVFGMENARVEVMSLKSGATKTLVTEGYFGRYLPSNGTHGYTSPPPRGSLRQGEGLYVPGAAGVWLRLRITRLSGHTPELDRGYKGRMVLDWLARRTECRVWEAAMLKQLESAK